MEAAMSEMAKKKKINMKFRRERQPISDKCHMQKMMHLFLLRMNSWDT